MSDERYPIGKFTESEYKTTSVSRCIEVMEVMPQKLIDLLQNASEDKMKTPIREGAWTSAQICYHLVDSHMNAYMRHMLTLTEEKPTIKPYDQDAWVDWMPSNHNYEHSLQMLKLLHRRWCAVLKKATPEQMIRTFFHPEGNKDWTLELSIRLYAWHGEHHMAQIAKALK